MKVKEIRYGKVLEMGTGIEKLEVIADVLESEDLHTCVNALRTIVDNELFKKDKTNTATYDETKTDGIDDIDFASIAKNNTAEKKEDIEFENTVEEAKKEIEKKQTISPKPIGRTLKKQQVVIEDIDTIDLEQDEF